MNKKLNICKLIKLKFFIFIMLFIFIIFFFITYKKKEKKNKNEKKNKINLYMRDPASGIRTSIEKKININKEKFISNFAEINSNADMIWQVSRDKNALGYTSLSSILFSDKIFPLKYNNIDFTKENILNKKYDLLRSFYYITRKSNDFENIEKEELVFAFIDFLVNSIEANEYILNYKFIPDINKKKISWNDLKKKHPITQKDNSHIILKTCGSTSIEKVLKKIIDLFIPLAGNFQYSSNHTGSGDAWRFVLGNEKNTINSSDIGFVSREFYENENFKDAKLFGIFAKDIIVFIVNKERSNIKNISENDLIKIFTGEIYSFDDLTKNNKI